VAKVTLADSALNDLRQLVAHYEREGAPAVGHRLVRQILAAVERLEDFPDSGRIVPEFGVQHLREVIDPPFRIVYRRDPERVRVVRVWRSERLLDAADV